MDMDTEAQKALRERVDRIENFDDLKKAVQLFVGKLPMRAFYINRFSHRPGIVTLIQSLFRRRSVVESCATALLETMVARQLGEIVEYNSQLAEIKDHLERNKVQEKLKKATEEQQESILLLVRRGKDVAQEKAELAESGDKKGEKKKDQELQGMMRKAKKDPLVFTATVPMSTMLMYLDKEELMEKRHKRERDFLFDAMISNSFEESMQGE